MLNKLFSKIKKNKRELSIIAVLLLVSGLAHGYNMFHFPYYENDEGVYISQAWSLLTQARLAPYTYWYDHAPAGWILIALWTKLTGGFFTFGFSINSGRVLMLILHLISSLLMYSIVKKLTESKLAAFIGVLSFSLSPLGIYFQRRVLLDNIMVFWLLISLYFLVFYKNRLKNIIFSAVAFGFAVLSKETAIFLAPVYLYVVLSISHKYHKHFAVLKWLVILGMVVSFYVLYALLKGEFFPYGSLFGGSSPHVSLIEALKFQAGRGGGSIFDLKDSSFWYNFSIWIKEDPLIVFLGIVATVGNLIFGIKHFGARIISLLSLSFWFFLMRGGLVIEFYVIPLIPILAMNIGVFIFEIKSLVGKVRFFGKIASLFSYLMLVVIVVSSLYFSTNIRDLLNIYTSDQTTPQIDAVNWILAQNIPDAFYVIDNYGYIDLQEKKKYPNVHTEWYWKVDKDPDVREKLLNNDKNNVDFIALTPQMKNDIAYSGLGLSLSVWKASHPVVVFSNDMWDVDIWANTDAERILKSTWESYKKHFMVAGRVVDPYQEHATTSEAQSYALLRSVWIDDKKTFDEVLLWTEDHLLTEDGLFSWKWEGSDETGGRVDDGTATDADQDIALALLFAYKRWGQEEYLNDAQMILNFIWDHEVVTVNDIPYLTAGNWANQEFSAILNPSYLSPASYRIFAKADHNHDWSKLAESSYRVLGDCTSDPLDKDIGVLPPEWCAIDKGSGIIGQSVSPQPTSTEYSYGAFRTPWRVALDYRWFNTVKAKTYLESLSLLSNEWASKNKIYTAYEHDGNVWEGYESVSSYSGNIGYFEVLYPTVAQEIYTSKIQEKLYEDADQSYWDDPENYYTQNWAWFGTALYSNNLPNLWVTDK